MSQEPSLCPCGTQKNFMDCCGRFIRGGAAAPTPELLMRSRYTAFVLNDVPYLLATWHPETRPDDLGSDEPNNWVRLEILGSDEEGDEGEVEFRASLILDNRLEVLHETSEFDRIDGRWYYHSGEFENDGKPEKIAKGAPCPCGSGKKFVQCHYQK